MKKDVPNSFVSFCFRNLFTLIGLNLLFLLTCIPVLTIPASLTALANACHTLLADEKPSVRKYFRSFKLNFLPALPIGFIFVLGPMMVFYGCLFYYSISETTEMAIVLSVFCLICVYVLFCVGMFAFQSLARVNLRATLIIKNAFYLTFQHPRLIFSWFLIAFITIMAIWGGFPYSFPWLLLIGVSLPCIIVSRGALPIINSTIVKE